MLKNKTTIKGKPNINMIERFDNAFAQRKNLADEAVAKAIKNKLESKL